MLMMLWYYLMSCLQMLKNFICFHIGSISFYSELCAALILVDMELGGIP